MKEVTVFSYGDSTQISTWSNVPYFFTLTFEKKGIKVNRVDIAPHKALEKLFRYTFYVLLKIIDKRNTYDYSRSIFFNIEANIRIKKSVRKFQKSDAFIFLNFDFSTVRYTQIPSIQFGDWTYEHYINYFINKKANIFELEFIRRQNKRINESSIVFPLFPGMASNMKKMYSSKIVYLGNVINSLFESQEQEILRLKSNSYKILFIGSPKYIEGAKILLKTFNILKSKYKLMSLHFIGLEESDLVNIPDGVKCYGYLNKGSDTQRDIYYQLLKEAKVFVNTTPKWSAFSASIEAMYFYTPVIVPSYKEFVETFGENFSGGIYCNDETELPNKIEYIFKSKSYQNLCINAKELVKAFSWDAYIDKMIIQIKSL